MILRQQMLDAILSGKKTVTRRPVKYNEAGKILPARYKVDGGPGGTYALQGPPEEGSKARARTVASHRLRIKSVQMEMLGTIDDLGTRREVLYWWQLYIQVWRYEFELVEVGDG